MICPNCNRDIIDGAKFCGYCGSKLEITVAANATEVTNNNDTQPVSEVVESVAMPSVEVPQPVSEEVEPVAMPSVEVPQPVSEAVESVAMPSVEVPQPVSEAIEQVTAPSIEVPQPVSEAVESVAMPSVEVPQPVSEAIEQVTAPSIEVPQPVSEAIEQVTAPSIEVPQPVSEAVEPVTAPSIEVPQPASDPVDGSSNPSSLNGAAMQGMEPNAGIDGAAAAGQEGPLGGKAFNIAALLKNKLFLICVGALLLLVILIIIIANAAASGSSKGGRKGSYFFTVGDGEGVVLYNGTAVKGTDFSYFVNKLGESTDGTKILYEDNSELVLFDNGKAYTITDELYNSKAKLADSGAVVYISDGSLYLCSAPGSKGKEIAELDDPAKCEFAISPNGGLVVFSEYKYDDDDYWRENKKYSYLNAWDGKKLIDLDDKFGPHYVSNGGKLICGVDASGRFTYLKDLKPGSAEKLKAYSNMYPVSADHSKMMYVSDGNTYYFDASSKEPLKVSSKSFNILMPLNDRSYPKNLNTFYVTSNGAIYRFVKTKDSYDSEKIVSSASNVILSADGKAIIYRHNDEILKISVSNPDKELTVAEDVNIYTAFRCDPTLTHVYYIDDDGELRYASKKSKKIGSDVESFVVNDKGLCVYLTDDENIYYSNKGGDKVKISGVSDVISLGMADNIFYALTDDALYVSTDGKSFKKSVGR